MNIMLKKMLLHFCFFNCLYPDYAGLQVNKIIIDI
jgi:hypothetical protein